MNSLIAAACFAAFLTGCDTSHEGVSDDMSLFRNLIETDLPISSVRWEVFNTPEYTGGIPGPTDYVILIGEVEPAESERFQSGQNEGTVWVAPDAVRPWLSKNFRSLLKKHRNGKMDLFIMKNCRKLKGKLRKAEKPIEGFICSGHGKSLIYLTLSDNAAS